MVSNNTDGGPLSFGPNAKSMHIGLRLLAAEFHGCWWGSSLLFPLFPPFGPEMCKIYQSAPLRLWLRSQWPPCPGWRRRQVWSKSLSNFTPEHQSPEVSQPNNTQSFSVPTVKNLSKFLLIFQTALYKWSKKFLNSVYIRQSLNVI